MQQLSKILSGMGLNDWALVILVLSIFIDWVPAIKISPIKWLFKKLGQYFNASVEKEIFDFKVEVNSKFTSLQYEQIKQREALDNLIQEEKRKEISRTRYEIIDFASELRNGIKHSRTQYRRVLDDFDKYVRIINSNEIEDENYRDEKENFDFIKEYYSKHMNDNIDKLYF